MTETKLNSNKITKTLATKIYQQMLLDMCGMNEPYSAEKAQEEVISGSMVGDDQYLIKIKSDNFGTVFEHISLKGNKVVKYNSLQKKSNKLYKFSDSEELQYKQVKFSLK